MRYAWQASSGGGDVAPTAAVWSSWTVQDL